MKTMNGELKKTVIYCRIFEGHEDLAYQLACTSAFIQDHSDQLQLTKIYVDRNSSFDEQRRLIEDVFEGKVQVILIQDASVIQKDENDRTFLVKSPLTIGAEDHFYSDSEIKIRDDEYQTRNLFAKLRKRSEYMEDTELRRIISDDYRVNFRERMRKGELHINIPYGYIRDDKSMLPDPETAPIIKKIFEYAKNGNTPLDISRKLDAECIATPTKAHGWNPDTVKNILMNVAYIGTYAGGTEQRILGKKVKMPNDEVIIIENHHEPIIDKETFEIVNAMQKDRIAGRATKNQTAIEKDPDLFKGIIECALCGKRLVYQRAGGTRKTSKYYCQHHTGKDSNYQKLEKRPEILTDVLKQQVLEACNRFIDKLNAAILKLKEPPIELQQKNEFLASKISELGMELLPLYERFEADPTNADGIIEQWNTITDNYAGLWRDKSKVKEQMAHRSVPLCLLERYYRFSIDKFSCFNRMDVFDPELGRLFIQKLQLNPDGTIKIEFWFEDIIDLASEKLGWKL